MVSTFQEEMMKTVRSKNDVPIRLPDERWMHLTEGHSEMTGYHSEVLKTIEDQMTSMKGA
jgi:hypothetical protein